MSVPDADGVAFVPASTGDSESDRSGRSPTRSFDEKPASAVLSSTQSPHIELLQLTHDRLIRGIFLEDHRILVKLPSNSIIDLEEFVSKSFALLSQDPTKCIGTTSAHSVSIFFQFFAYITFMFDPVKFPNLAFLSQGLHLNQTLNDCIVEVALMYIISLDMSRPTNHNLDSLTNISNLFTILQNYITYEFSSDFTPICDGISSHESLSTFLEESVYLIGLSECDTISSEMKHSFRHHLVEFWNTLSCCPSLASSKVVSITVLNHPLATQLVTYLLEQISQAPHLQLLHMLIRTERFTELLSDNDWSEFRDQLLTTSLSLICTLTKPEDSSTTESLIALLDMFGSLMDMPSVKRYFLTQPIFAKQLLLRFLIKVSSLNDPTFKMEADTDTAMASNMAASLRTFYCKLHDPDDSFINLDLEAHDRLSLRSRLLAHLSSLLIENEDPSFAELVDRAARLNLKYPPFMEELDAQISEDMKAYLAATNFSLLSHCVHMSSLTIPNSDVSSVDAVNEESFTDDAIKAFLKAAPKVAIARADTKKRWIVQALEPVSQGSLITEFTGVIILNGSSSSPTCAAASSRCSSATLTPGSTSFPAEVPRKTSSLQRPFVLKLDEKTCIDAQSWGSIARCILHSCSPCARFQQVSFEGNNRLFVCAVRDIEKGETICCDYTDFSMGRYPPNGCDCGRASCGRSLEDVAAHQSDGNEEDVTDNDADSTDTAPSSPKRAQSLDEQHSNDSCSPTSGLGKRKRSEEDSSPLSAHEADLVMQSMALLNRMPAASSIASGSNVLVPASALQPGDVSNNQQAVRLVGRPVGPVHPQPTATTSITRRSPDLIMQFNHARGLPCRACTHISISRGIQMHRNATSLKAKKIAVKTMPSASQPQQQTYSAQSQTQPTQKVSTSESVQLAYQRQMLAKQQHQRMIAQQQVQQQLQLNQQAQQQKQNMYQQQQLFAQQQKNQILQSQMQSHQYGTQVQQHMQRQQQTQQAVNARPAHRNVSGSSGPSQHMQQQHPQQQQQQQPIRQQQPLRQSPLVQQHHNPAVNAPGAAVNMPYGQQSVAPNNSATASASPPGYASYGQQFLPAPPMNMSPQQYMYQQQMFQQWLAMQQGQPMQMPGGPPMPGMPIVQPMQHVQPMQPQAMQGQPQCQGSGQMQGSTMQQQPPQGSVGPSQQHSSPASGVQQHPAMDPNISYGYPPAYNMYGAIPPGAGPGMYSPLNPAMYPPPMHPAQMFSQGYGHAPSPPVNQQVPLHHVSSIQTSNSQSPANAPPPSSGVHRNQSSDQTNGVGPLGTTPEPGNVAQEINRPQ